MSALSHTAYIALLAASLLLTALPASADKTLRGRLKVDRGALQALTDSTARLTQRFDTLRSVTPSAVRLSGYDKPLTSRTESIFVTNRLGGEITEIEIRLTYSDMSGRMLHETVRSVRTIIPAGETRRVEFPSWDRQQSFYYHRGRKPRTAGVSPYDVRCEVISCVVPADSRAGNILNTD